MVLLVGCGSEEPAPSCQEGLSHYYQAGCSFTNLMTGQPISISEMIATCQGIAVNGPQCRDELDDWLVCLDAVPSPVTTAADCDCSAAQMAVLTCS